MRFRIHCSNPKTGQSHEFELEARDRAEAQREILNAGLVVVRIETATETPGDKKEPARRLPLLPVSEAAERATRRERRRIGVAGRIIGVCGVVTIVLALVGTILSGGSKASGYLDIQASIRFDGERFRIANMDDFPWRDVLIDINGGLANRGYTVRWDILVSKQAILADATDFVNDKGDPYDPVNEPIRQLRIFCDVGDGNKALHTRRWDSE